MGKYTKTWLKQQVAQGKALPVEHVVHGVQLADGNIHWLQDHDEEAMDSHIGVYDKRGVIETRRVDSRTKRKFDAFFKKHRTVGATIEHLLHSPLLAGILKDKGVKVDKIKEGLEILNWGDPEARIRFILATAVKELGSERANEVWQEIEAARADGRITQEEWLNIARKAGV